MKRIFLLLTCCVISAPAAGSELIFDKVRHSVVTVTARDEQNQIDSEGSGVVVATDRVVTNCHVVNEANTIEVRAADKTFPATLTLSDTIRDLCQLAVPGLAAPPAKIRSYLKLEVGEEVYAVGNPLGLGLSLSTGLVSSIGQYRSETQIYSSAPVSPGSSGGGLFDTQGRLVGIVTGSFSPGQNFNIALPADWIGEISHRVKPGVKSNLTRSADPDWKNDAESLRQTGQWAKLAELARQWLAAYPTSAQANYYLAVALYNQNKVHEAEAALLQAIHLDPFFATAYGYLAVTRQSLGEKEAAQIDIQRAIQLDPSNGYYWSIQARIQSQIEQNSEALYSAQMVVKLSPEREDNWKSLGVLLHKMGNLTEAIKAYQTALRLNPDFPVAWSGLAAAQAALGQTAAAQQSLLSATGGKVDSETWEKLGFEEVKQNQFSEAERMYRKALELDPGSATAWYQLALILQRSNRVNETEDALLQTIKFNPAHESAWVTLGTLLTSRGDRENALAAFKKATLINPNELLAWLGLGGMQHDMNNHTEAVTALTKATQLAPTDIKAWVGLGLSQAKLKLWDEALQSMKVAEKLDPKNAKVNFYFSYYYMQRNDPEQALIYIDRSLEVDRADPATWGIKGANLLKLERYSEAVQALETAIKLKPDLAAYIWTSFGESLLRMKQLGKAITTLEHAIELAPNEPDSRLYLAQAYRYSGQSEKAKEHLDVLLKKHPQHAPALYMLTTIYLSEGKQSEGLAAYTRLKTADPAMAQNLREKNRAGKLTSGVSLPD